MYRTLDGNCPTAQANDDLRTTFLDRSPGRELGRASEPTGRRCPVRCERGALPRCRAARLGSSARRIGAGTADDLGQRGSGRADDPARSPGLGTTEDRSTRRTLPSAVKTIGAVLLVVAVFVSGIAIGKGDAPSTGQSTGAAGVPASLPPQFATYLEAWKILQDNYVDPAALDPTKLTYGSVNGLVEAVGDTGPPGS